MFSKTLDFSLPAHVNFVGGGGKTSLILKLLDEYAASIPCIYTTTTRIHPPHPADGLTIIMSDRETWLQTLLERAVSNWSVGRKFVATHLPSAPDLLAGVDPGFAARLDRGLFPLVLNEADGARSMSIKMPRQNEPVLMTGADYLVPLIGLDCLGRPMGPETVFRWEIASRRCNLKKGAILTPETAAAILLHPQGVCRDWTPGVRIIPFINKVDTEEDEAQACALADALLQSPHFPVERVVYGSVLNGTAESVARQ